MNIWLNFLDAEELCRVVAKAYAKQSSTKYWSMKHSSWISKLVSSRWRHLCWRWGRRHPVMPWTAVSGVRVMEYHFPSCLFIRSSQSACRT